MTATNSFGFVGALTGGLLRVAVSRPTHVTLPGRDCGHTS